MPTEDQILQALGGAALPSFNPAEFNIEHFRLSQSFEDHAGGEKPLTTIPVRKPSKETFFRTHPDTAYRFQAVLLELKERSETYLVAPSLLTELQGESTLASKMIIPTMTRQGTLLMWPIKLPSPEGYLDPWNQSALEAADQARTKWVRMVSNKSLGAYEIIIAANYREGARWPEKSLDELIRIAFKGRVIQSVEHPVIQALRGEA